VNRAYLSFTITTISLSLSGLGREFFHLQNVKDGPSFPETDNPFVSSKLWGRKERLFFGCIRERFSREDGKVAIETGVKADLTFNR
jgi:hypothetical protein